MFNYLSEKINELGVRIRILGEISLLPADLQEICSKLMLISKDNNRFSLNLAIAYTSREEMTTSIRDICQGVKSKEIELWYKSNIFIFVLILYG